MSIFWSATLRSSWFVLTTFHILALRTLTFLILTWSPNLQAQAKPQTHGEHPSAVPGSNITAPLHDDFYLNQGITVYADTTLKENIYGTAIRADVGQIAVKDLSELTLVGPDGEDILTGSSNNNRHLEVGIIMPAALRKFEQDAFINTVKTMLEVRFGSKRLIIKPLLIDVGLHETEVVAANNEIKYIVDHAVAPISPELNFMAMAMQETNARILALLKSWQNSFSLTLNRQLKDPEARTLLFGSIIGSGSSISPVYFWLTQTGANPIGILQAMLSVGYDQLNTRYSTRLIKFEAEHNIPFFKSTPLVRLYNGSTLLKAIAVNFAINAGAGLSFRTLSYFADPESVASPLSTDFLADWGGINLVGSLLTSGSDIGVRTLRKKGYISQSTELIANSVFNFTTQINNLLLGSGYLEYLPFGLAIEWTAKSAVSILSRALPTKNNRFVILHSGITPSDQKAVLYLNDLNEALSRQDLSLPELRERIQTFSWKEEIRQKTKVMYKGISNYSKELISQFKSQFYRGCRYLRLLR